MREDMSNDPDSASEDTETPKKHSRPPKHSCVNPAGSDGDEKEPVTAPKKRGHPRKVVDSEETHSSRVSFNVPVYVEMAVPPKLKPGKTYKGNKMEKQEPRMEGPFTLTRKMSWEAFLIAILNTVDEELENLLIEVGYTEKRLLPTG